MGLEEMLSTIRANTQEQSAKIITEAKLEAEKISSEAKQRSESIVAQGQLHAEKEVQEEKLRSVASARLEAKRRLLEARDEVLRSYEEQAMLYLDEFTKSKDYADFLLRAIKDGVSKIGSGSVVQVNSKDKSLLESNADFELSPETLDCKGGALITSKDGKRRVDNTIESIFYERRGELRLKLTEQVFGKHG